MLPIVASLLANGLTLLGNAVMAKGQDFIEEKVGVKLDSLIGTEEGKIKLAQIEADNEAELRKFVLAKREQEIAEFRVEVEDRTSARNRDVELAKVGRRNNRADLMFLLAVAIIGGLVWIVWKDQGINEYVKGIFTLVLGRFLGYLDNIYNFEFGTTRSSRDKDTTIEQLSRGPK